MGARNTSAILVSVNDLEACGERGHFARRPGESAVAFAMRLMANDTADCNEGDKRKVLRYAHAMARGTRFPPILVLRQAGGYFLADGYHRAAAAALLGRAAIPAVVLAVASDAEADRALDLFHRLEFGGASTTAALAAVSAVHARRRAA